jgi:hypothetical protein
VRNFQISKLLFVGLLFIFAACSTPAAKQKPTDPLVALAMSSQSSKREIATLERMGLAPKWEYAQKVQIEGLDYVLVFTKNINYQLHYAFKGTELVSSRLFVIEANTKDLQQLAIYDLLARRADRIKVNPVTKEAISLDSYPSGYGSEFADSLSRQAISKPLVSKQTTYSPPPCNMPLPDTNPAPGCPAPGKPAPEKEPKPKNCVLPESIKNAIGLAEKGAKIAQASVQDAYKNLELARRQLVAAYAIAGGGALGMGATAVATGPLCLTGVGCIAPAAALAGSAITAAAGAHQVLMAREAVENAITAIGRARDNAEVAESTVQNAKKAAEEWKNDNCN